MGTGPTSHPTLLSFRGNFLCFSLFSKFQKAICFEDNFTVALYSFGGKNDQCGAMSWAVQETGMLPLMSFDNDMMTVWLKDK